MRVGLIACCKQKLDHAAPARELYCSPMFRLSRDWMDRRLDSGALGEWAILSAKHGLVMPDQVLEPYDQQLGPFDERKRWGLKTRWQLKNRFGDSVVYMVLAGVGYRSALDGLLIEDVINHWTQQRRDRGMTGQRAAMGIGLILKALKEDRPYQ